MNLLEELKRYKNGETERSWMMDSKGGSVSFENEYIKLVRIDTSNKWVGDAEMIKQWSIIFHQKKVFSHLPNYLLLKNNFNIRITPVSKGINKGCYGLRIYEMKKDPNEQIVLAILKFIFNN